MTNTLAMWILGGLTGLVTSVPPIRLRSQITYDLNQDWKSWARLVWALWVAAVALVIWRTDLEFRWTPFLVSMLAAGVIGRELAGAVFDGKLLRRWTAPMRALYRNEWYRYAKYESKLASFLDQFDPAHAQSFGNVLACAHLSGWAYRTSAEIARQGAAWKVPVRAIEARNHFAIVVRMPSAVIVAFRGTDDIRDWLTNLAVWQRSPWGAEWGRVHGGFLGAVDALWPQLTDALVELKCDDGTPIWLTGHSLGGAMAVIAAVKLMHERPQAPIGGVYTFGQPMVGNREFAKVCAQRLSTRLARFVACRDSIPNQPPSGAHGGTLMYFDRNGAIRENPGRNAMFWDGIRRETLGAAGDHPMREYLRLVEQALVSTPPRARS